MKIRYRNKPLIPALPSIYLFLLCLLGMIPTAGAQTWTLVNEDETYTARHECSFVQAGDKFYLMGGRENSQNIDIYDYTSDSWETLTNSAPAAFNHFQATEYQGLIWIIGAFKNNSFPNETPEERIWIFNPATETWIQGPLIPAGRRRGSAGLSVYNDKFYISGGNTIGHNGGFVSWFDSYDPLTGEWTVLEDLPRARDHFHSAVVGNNLYLAGGRLSGGAGGVFAPTIPEVDVYDLVSGTWSTLPASQNIPTPRGAASAASFNGQLLIIGGEVLNEDVYGVNTDDALNITEAYNPNSQSWQRLSDLNFERHGTQAIVSGQGVFLLAGSPARGGGNQKNMEFYGSNAPEGDAIVAGILDAPDAVIFETAGTQTVNLQLSGGNVAAYIRSMTISGPDAADFTLTSGSLQNGLILPDTSRSLEITLTGTGDNRNAVLNIAYGASSTLNILLSTTGDGGLEVTNPGNQYHVEGDAVNLAIAAAGIGNLAYSATGLPPGLSINPNSGVISGTISDGSGGEGTYMEANGLAIIEAESGTIVPAWSITNIGGTTGIVPGTDSFNNQNGGTIAYEIMVSTPGVYRFNWNSLFSGTDSTEENDNWLRFPNNNDVWFFGLKGAMPDESAIIDNLQGSQTNVVFPIGSSRITPETTPEGAGSNGYQKIYRSGGSPETYSWQAKTSDNDPHDVFVWFVNPGTYTMDVSERSIGHAIDRMALYKVDGPDYSNAQLSALPPSATSGGGSGAADNSPYQVNVTVTDEAATPASESVQFSWIITETLQLTAIPRATPMTGEAPLQVNFTGSESVDDEAVTSYLWDFGDGSPTDGTENPVHTFTSPGIYIVTLTVGDAEGNTDSNTLSIEVEEPANAPPLAILGASPVTGVAPLEVAFTGSDSTDDNGVVTYLWNFDDDTPDAEQSDPVHTFTTPGSYVVTLTVTDVAGSSNSNTVTIEVLEPVNLPPDAIIEADIVSGPAPLEVTFTGSNSLDDLGITNYLWDFKDGTTSGSADPVHIFSVAGIYEVELTVTDAGGLTNTSSILITVTEPGSNAPPDAVAESNITEGLAPLTVVFNGSTSTDDAGIVQYDWDFTDGGNSDEADPTYTFTAAGIYEVILTVSDEEGLTDTDTLSITVTDPSVDLPPVAVATAIPTSGSSPLSVQFNGSNSYDDSAVTSYQWDFQDGGSSTEMNPVHIFETDGTYNVSLTVTDDTGNTAIAIVTVTVGMVENEAPVAVIQVNATSGEAPLEITFTGSQSLDDFDVESFFWQFGDGASSDQVDPVYTFQSPGDYIVVLTVTDAGGLISTATITISVVETAGPLVAMILENPTRSGNGLVRLLHLPEEVVPDNIYLHDSTGRLLSTLEPEDQFNETNSYTIPVATLMNGLYFVTVELNTGEKMVLKLLVQN